MTSPAVTLTVQQLDHLEGLLAAATPGPWRVPGFWPNGLQSLEHPTPMEHDTWDHLGSLVHWPDATLVAELVNLAPALLATVRRQQAALDAVTELAAVWAERGTHVDTNRASYATCYFDLMQALKPALPAPAPTEATT